MNAKMQNNMPDKSSICLKTEHFLIFANKTQKEIAEYFSDLLEKNYLKIHKDFHFPLITKKTSKTSENALCCYLCNSIPEYLQQTGKKMEDYEPWMVGLHLRTSFGRF
mgnify:CR=1 FL=1